MLDGFIRVGMASPSLKVGNTLFNEEKIISLIKKAIEKKIKILLFPELAITGYTVQDLFFNRALLLSAESSLKRIVKETEGEDILVFVGYPLLYNGKLYNTAAVLQNGKIVAYIPKTNIPEYGEFYEGRWFTPFRGENIIVSSGEYNVPFGSKIIFEANVPSSCKISCEICEDVWVPKAPSYDHSLHGATIILNLSSSNEIVGKSEYRRNLIKMQSARTISGYLYCSSSEDESTQDMVFTGHNIICENGNILSEKVHSYNELVYSEIDTDYLENERAKRNTFPSSADDNYLKIKVNFKCEKTPLSRVFEKEVFVPRDKSERNDRCKEILLLQALALKKRMESINCKDVVLGVSGGLDSTLALLVSSYTFSLMSLPLKNIHAYSLPCFGTSGRTKNNAELLSLSLGVSFEEVSIAKSVSSHFRDISQSENTFDTSYENAQARERTQFLFDKANMLNAIVVGTGDLSELALGWCTFNGDHMSNYGVNGDLPKTAVRMVVEYVSEKSKNKKLNEVLSDVLDTPISPELIPSSSGEEQRSEDTLGRYELHDFFLYYFVRRSYSPGKIYRLALLAFGEENEDEIYNTEEIFIKRFFLSQFKRSALPDGPKLGSVSLSPRSDWRMSSDTDLSIFLKNLEERK